MSHIYHATTFLAWLATTLSIAALSSSLACSIFLAAAACASSISLAALVASYSFLAWTSAILLFAASTTFYSSSFTDLLIASNIFALASLLDSSWASLRCSKIVWSAVFWFASATALTTDEWVWRVAGTETTVGIELDSEVTVVSTTGAGLFTTTAPCTGPGTGTYLVTGTTLCSTYLTTVGWWWWWWCFTTGTGTGTGSTTTGAVTVW